MVVVLEVSGTYATRLRDWSNASTHFRKPEVVVVVDDDIVVEISMSAGTPSSVASNRVSFTL